MLLVSAKPDVCPAKSIAPTLPPTSTNLTLNTAWEGVLTPREVQKLMMWGTGKMHKEGQRELNNQSSQPTVSADIAHLLIARVPRQLMQSYEVLLSRQLEAGSTRLV